MDDLRTFGICLSLVFKKGQFVYGDKNHRCMNKNSCWLEGCNYFETTGSKLNELEMVAGAKVPSARMVSGRGACPFAMRKLMLKAALFNAK